MGKLETKDDMRESIERAIEQDGQFSHNICSLTLRVAEAKFGRAYANSLVEQYCLTDLYGIHKMKGAKNAKRR